MARSYSILIPIGILVLACSTSSTPTAPSLEDQLQQLRKDFVRKLFVPLQCLSVHFAKIDSLTTVQLTLFRRFNLRK